MKTRSFTARLTGLVAVIAAAPLPAAETHGHPHAHEIPEIIVTADPLGDVDGHFLAPTTVLDGDALERESMRSIGDAVANQLGVSSSDFGASVGRPVIRGLGGARVRVLENGIGTMDVSSISADHGVSAEPLFAEQIEILRGPATLLYGSGASGGLVNVSNARIASELPDAAELNLYGHYNTVADEWLGAFKLDAALGRHVAVHFDGLRRDNNDVSIPGFASLRPDSDERPGTLANSSADAHNYAGGASLIGEDGYFGIAVSQYDNEYGVPGAHVHDEHDDVAGDEAAEEGGTRIDMQQSRYDLAGAWHLDRFMIERAKIRWGFNNYAHDEIEADGAIGTMFSNDEWEGRLEFILQPMGRWDGVVGFQFTDKDFKAIGEEAFVAPSSRDSQALFVFEKADFGNIHVDLGVRLETQHAASKLLPGTVDHHLLSLSGGASWHYRPDQELGFSASRSQRAPSIEELFAGGPHLASNTFEIGNPHLGEETSHSLDVFWRKNAGRVRFGFTAFVNDIADFTFLRFNDRNGDGVADRVEEDFADTGMIVDEDDALLLVSQTQADALFWGLELETEATVFDNHYGLLDLRVWTDRVSGEFDDGSYIPRIPPPRFGGALNWSRGAYYAQLAATRTMQQEDLAALETGTGAFTELNVQAGYRATVGKTELSIFARGSNLLDETQRRHVSFVKDLAPRPGIAGLVGIRLRY